MMNRKNRKILIVTYVFPPYAAVGVYRILKFCKYLPEFGYHPVILTPSAPNVMARDEGLHAQVAADIPVYRTPSWEPFRVKQSAKPGPAAASPTAAAPTASPDPSLPARLKTWVKNNLSVPDASMLWNWSGAGVGRKAIRREKIDIVLSSSPPQSAHLLGSKLAIWSGCPHVVDFRDLWTQNTSYHERQLPEYLARRDRKYELTVLRRAAAISVNTSTFKRQLLQNNDFLTEPKLEVVNNGVDPDDFSPFLSSATPNERFTMLYTGSLYGGHRNPEFFLAALGGWFESRPGLRERVKVKFIGNWTPEYLGLIERHNLAAVVEKKDWMPQREALAQTFAADLLLLFQGFDPALSAAIPRKLYEYMITNKPILAFAPPGEIPDIIERYDCGVCLSTTAPEPIREVLNRTYDSWRRDRTEGPPSAPSLRPMPELETRSQVAKLARLCDHLKRA